MAGTRRPARWVLVPPASSHATWGLRLALLLAVQLLVGSRDVPASGPQRVLQQATEDLRSNASNISEINTTNLTTTTALNYSTLVSEWNHLCGDYVRPCEKVAHIPFGPDIWISSSVSYRSDFTYQHVERGFFNRTACEREDAWLEIRYSGHWSDGGVSRVKRTNSLASVEVSSVWLKLWYEEVCVELVDAEIRCMKTLATIAAMCPCNGWDWANKGEPRERNIGMFCKPHSQCPLIDEVYLQQTHYLTYNATMSTACFSKANNEMSRGWERPEDLGCSRKERPMLCVGPISAAGGRHGRAAVLGAAMALALLGLVAQPAGIARS